MKLVEIILKAIVAAVIVVMGLKLSSVFEIIMMFGMVYGLLTYYIWYFRKRGFSVKTGSLVTTAFSLIFTLILPLLIIVIPYIALTELLPGQSGMYIGGILLIVLCFGCVAMDVIEVIRTFQPSFLEGFDLGTFVKDAVSKRKTEK
ncbi:MAG: hypothetical protein HFI69_01330 [Lachnospiraceae bacterium]|nr:hypothetical protein [Lachnospiraceae bacterium]